MPTVSTGEGDSWSTACMDVVVSGLGWVALTGLGPVKVRTWAPPGVEVIVRDPLMPFEARTSTEKYTGAGDKKGTSRCRCSGERAREQESESERERERARAREGDETKGTSR